MDEFTRILLRDLHRERDTERARADAAEAKLADVLQRVREHARLASPMDMEALRLSIPSAFATDATARCTCNDGHVFHLIGSHIEGCPAAPDATAGEVE